MKAQAFCAADAVNSDVSCVNLLDDLRRYLPRQGPLEFFIHHNTFHALEHLPFHEALQLGQDLYGGNVLKKLSEYRYEAETGRITSSRLVQAIDAHLRRHRVAITPPIQALALRLMGEVEPGWDASETPFTWDWLVEMDEARTIKPPTLREKLRVQLGIDIDDSVQPLILRFMSLYFDQGSAYWSMPRHPSGLLATFCQYYRRASSVVPKWERQLAQMINANHKRSAIALIDLCLAGLGIAPRDARTHLMDLALCFKGWAGLILSFESHPEWNRRPSINTDFTDFMAIIMMCEYALVKSLSEQELTQLQLESAVSSVSRLYDPAYVQLVQQLIGLGMMDPTEPQQITTARSLTDFNRRFVWHEAFEASFYQEFLGQFRNAQAWIAPICQRPTLQVICCLDEREESLRRHLEELNPLIETFGVAGHFGLDLRFKGLLDAGFRSYCPEPVKPTKNAYEELLGGHQTRAVYQWWGTLLWLQSIGAKTLLRGTVLHLATSVVAMVSLTMAILMPRWSTAFKRRMKATLDANLVTRVALTHGDGRPLSTDERAIYAINLFTSIGLRNSFAPVVVILGHGSQSVNNPHRAAYDCGACGGARGGINARIMANILNDLDVRANLKGRGIAIPEDTVFIGGWHNTCSDDVHWTELAGNSAAIGEATQIIRRALRSNSHERCRRFDDVELKVNDIQSQQACRVRSNDFMQARPEYGHATNAICVIGPRHLTRPMFLDRRAFLQSYDPDSDTEDSSILRQILVAAGPVCAGINLEYFFSHMDNKVYGCGTKLPHNVSSLVGVMNGHQSDLLMGLPQQMIEIHDPFRMLLLVCTDVHSMNRLLREISEFRHLVVHQWIHLAIYDQKLDQLLIYNHGQFESCSIDNLPEVVFSNNRSAYQFKRGNCSLGILDSNNG